MTSPEYGDMAVTESPENDPNGDVDNPATTSATVADGLTDAERSDAKPPRSFLGLRRFGPFGRRPPSDDSPPETEPVVESPRGRGN